MKGLREVLGKIVIAIVCLCMFCIANFSTSSFAVSMKDVLESKKDEVEFYITAKKSELDDENEINNSEIKNVEYVPKASLFGLTGDGSEANPYLINTVEDLDAIRNELSACYKLNDDIDLAGVLWEPVGDTNNYFTGTLDGNNHKISNLTINSDQNDKALFAYFSGNVCNLEMKRANITGEDNVAVLVANILGTTNKKISNVKITDCNVSGRDNVGGLVGNTTDIGFQILYSSVSGSVSGRNNVGGLVGYQDSAIRECYSTATVTSTGENVGGLTGSQIRKIYNCFATGAVTGDTNVGGLVGFSDDHIYTSYSIGAVTGNTNVGGFRGITSGGYSAVNSYWTPETSNQYTSGVGTALKEERRSITNLSQTIGYNSWDFTNVWSIVEGETLAYLTVFGPIDEINLTNINNTVVFDEGNGTSSSPYMIKNVNQLKAINNDLSCYYTLANEIDLNNEEWTPIGDNNNVFKGVLNGNNNYIKNVSITGNNSYVGLFSNNEGIITNLKLQNVNITGNTCVGGIAGYSTGTISNIEMDTINISGENYVGGAVGTSMSKSLGTVSNVKINNLTINGDNYVGGLIGYTYNTVANSSVKGTVTATGNYVGGVLGCNYNSYSIQKSYSSGSVTGVNFVGGLIGYQDGDIFESYSTMNVTGTENVGGLVGLQRREISNSFQTGEVIGDNCVGGLVGYTEAERTYNSYSIGKVTGNTNVGGLRGLCSANYRVVNSYWTPETSTQFDSCAGSVYKANRNSIVKMLKTSGYNSWNFTNIWQIDEGSSIAYLRNLDKPTEILLENIDNEVEFDSGDGTVDNPYIITTKQQFKWINNNLDINYKLGGTIDFEGEEIVPLGNYDFRFKGILDGNGFEIKNAKVISAEDYMGLFGCNEGTIRNVTLRNIEVEGNDNVGTLVGYSSGIINNIKIVESKVTGNDNVGGLVGKTVGQVISSNVEKGEVNGANNVGGLIGIEEKAITECYASTTINATGNNVGGLIGNQKGQISKCYSDSDITTAVNNVGGLIGLHEGETYDCYSTGSINGANNVGGLIGYIKKGNTYTSYSIAKTIGNSNTGGVIGSSADSYIVKNVYWCPSATLQTESFGGERKTIDELSVLNTYNEWNFDTIWQIDEGESTAYLQVFDKPDSVVKSSIDISPFDGGEGTENNPYMIRTAEQLAEVRNYLDKHFKLSGDIELYGIEWEPIGNETTKFTGSFDGNGKKISSFVIENSGPYKGLFGYNEGNIKSLSLRKIKITGTNYVGALAGYSTGKISGISIDETEIEGEDYVGGLIGYSDGGLVGSITETVVEAISGHETDNGTKNKVTGNNYVGGLVGYCNNEIIKSSACADVLGMEDNVGGLVGYAKDYSIKQSYAKGSIVAMGNTAGGLIGKQECNIEQCYSTADVQAMGSNAGGLVGYVNGQVVNCYETGTVAGVDNIGGLIGYIQTGSVVNTYAIGEVQDFSDYGANNIGGLIGGSNIAYPSMNSYWCAEYTNQSSSKGGTSYTIEEMLKSTNFENWDFVNVWKILEGYTTPYFQYTPKPLGVQIHPKENEGPEIAEVNVANGSITSRSAILNLETQDVASGVQTIEVYVDYVLVRSFNYEIPQKELLTGDVQLDNLLPNKDYTYYIIVRNFDGQVTKSDERTFRTAKVNKPVITATPTELTKENVQIVIEADKADYQKIQFSTASFTNGITSLFSTIVYPNTKWTDYTESFEVDRNQIIYARLTDGVNYSDIASILVDNIDKYSPKIIATDEGNRMTLNFEDVGVAGLDSFSYYISNRKLIGDEVPTYGEEISLQYEKSYSINYNPGENFIYVKVKDKLGNEYTERFGGYYLPDTPTKLVIEKCSYIDKRIKLKGAEFNIEGQTKVTDSDGLCEFELMPKSMGIFEYDVIESKAPDNYYLMENGRFDVTYNYYGKIVSVQPISPYINVEKIEDNYIKLSISNRVKNGAYYSIKVQAVDSENPNKVIENVKYKTNFRAETGENFERIDITDSNGIVDYGYLAGSGEIIIETEEISPEFGYYENLSLIRACLIRDHETGVVKLDPDKNTSDLDISISKDKQEILIKMKCKPKEVVPALTLKIEQTKNGIVSRMANVKFSLVQPFGLGNITGISDMEGRIEFNNLEKYGEGDYIYDLIPTEENQYTFNPIKITVSYDRFGQITNVREITSELTKIENIKTETANSVIDDNIMYLDVNLDNENLEYMKFVLRVRDKDDTNKLLPEVKYYTVQDYKGILPIGMGTSDSFGEICHDIIEQDRISIKISQQTAPQGYKVDNFEYKVFLDKDPATGKYIVDRDNSYDGYTITYDEATNTLYVDDYLVKKINETTKGEINLKLTKFDNQDDRALLEGVKFTVTETTTETQYDVVTDKNGIAKIENFSVKELGRYEFIITETESVLGFDVFEEPVKLEIIYTYDKEENCMKATTVEVFDGEQYVIEKRYKESETDTLYILDVDLDLTNFASLEGARSNITIMKKTEETNLPLKDAWFEIRVLYSNGTGYRFERITNNVGNIVTRILIPDGRTVLQIREIESPIGYKLDASLKTIVLNRVGETITIESSDLEAEIVNDLDINISYTNKELDESEKLVLPEKSEESGEDTDNPDDPSYDPDNPNPTPGPGGSDKKRMTITVINQNRYNPNLKMENSTFNVQIVKNSNVIYSKSKTITRISNNKVEYGTGAFDSVIDVDGNFQIKLKQTSAPLHHEINSNEYVIGMSRDLVLNEMKVNSINIVEDFEISVDDVNNKIIIIVKNVQTELLFGITATDSNNPDLHIENTGFVISKFIDLSEADLETLGYLQTDEYGYGSKFLYSYSAGKVTYKIDNVYVPVGHYLVDGTIGLDLTVDNSGNITAGKVLNGGIFASNVCTIRKIDGKYIELEIYLDKETSPTYNIKLINKNSENINEPVRGAEYDFRILQENGSTFNSVNKITDFIGAINLNSISGTGQIDIEIKQTAKAIGYKYNSETKHVSVNREIIDTNSGEQGVITLNQDGTDSDLDVEIDNVNNLIIIKVLSEPEYGIFINKTDYFDTALLMPDIEFTLTSVEGQDNITEKTNYFGEAFFKLGRPIVNETVNFTLTENNTMPGYQLLDPIEFTVTFDESGKITEYSTGDNEFIAGLTAIDPKKPVSFVKFNVFNLEEGIDINGDREPSNMTIDDWNKKSFDMVINKRNSADPLMPIPKTIFDINITAETGDTKHAIGITDEFGDIYVKNIKGSGIITIEITELESPTGFQVDTRTRTITISKTFDSNNDVSYVIVENATTDDWPCSFEYVWADEFGGERITLNVGIDNGIAKDKIGIGLEKFDLLDNSIRINGAVFDIKDVETNESYRIQTNGWGMAFITLPIKETAGTYEYRIIEQDVLYAYSPVSDIAELMITFDDFGKIVDAELRGVDEDEYKIHHSDERYIKLDAYDNRKDIGVDPYDLVILKVEKGDNTVVIPNSLLETYVTHQLGMNIVKKEITDLNGKVYLNQINGVGKININIKELVTSTLYARTIRTVNLTRNPDTGEFKLVSSINADIDIDNVNKVITVTIKNQEETSKAGFIVEKVDESDETIKISNVGFTVMDTSNNTGNVYSTDEVGRFNVPFPDTGEEVTLSIQETAVGQGYLDVPEVKIDAKYENGKVILNMRDSAGIATIDYTNEGVDGCPKVIIKNTQDDLKVGAYKLEIVKVDKDEEDIVIPNTLLKVNITNEVGVSNISKEVVTDEHGRIYFNKINGAGDINIKVQELLAAENYELDFEVRDINLNRNTETGEITFTDANNIDASNIEIDNSSRTIKILVPNKLKDGKYNLTIQKVDENLDPIKAANIKFDIAEIRADTTNPVAVMRSSNVNGKIIFNGLDMPETDGVVRYVIKEIQPPVGYKINQNTYEFEVVFKYVDGLMTIDGINTSDETIVPVVEALPQFAKVNFVNKEHELLKLYLESDVYEIDDTYCDRVAPNTPIGVFISNLKTNGTLRVFDLDGNEIDTTDMTTLVGTGFKVRAERGELYIEKDVVVTGDINGDGKVTIADTSAVNRAFLGLSKFNEIRSRAADIVKDGKLKISDTAKINRYFLGLETNLL